MNVDGRQPVLVGVGQINWRDGDSPEPITLLAEAVRRAGDDSGGRVLTAVRSIRVVNLLSRRYADPGRMVADALGLDIDHTVYTTGGGQTPAQLVNRACSDIANGQVDAVVVGGVESWRTRSRLKQRGEASGWSTQADVQPSELFGVPLQMSNDDETCLNLTDPIQTYPMFEQALRARHHRTLTGQLAVASQLWARLSKTAMTNEYAAIRTGFSAEQISSPGPNNRMVGFPYPKLMCSNSSVDQAGAILLCSTDLADGVGVPKDRRVFLHGAAEGNEAQFLSERHSLSESPAIAAVGTAALQQTSIGIDDVAHIDLYSCFPSAVQVAAEALNLSLDRSLTVTGGLTFAGGPWNSYVVHALATMAARLRQDPDSYGLVSANGGFLTKHAIGVWSCRPPVNGTRWRSVQYELDRSIPRRVAAPRHVGPAVLETYTVLHHPGRDSDAWGFAITAQGHRTLVTTNDSDFITTLETEDVLGQQIEARDGTLLGFP